MPRPATTRPTRRATASPSGGRGLPAPFIVKEAVTWLKQHRDQPKHFLLSVWAHERIPIKSAPEFKARYNHHDVQREHHANVTQLDHAFGQLMRAPMNGSPTTRCDFHLRQRAQATASRRRARLGGCGPQRSVYGRHCVPGIVRWPGKARPGTTSDVPVIGSDVFVTVATIAGAALPRTACSTAATSGRARRPPVERARPLYWRCVIAPEPLKTAMRIGDWKISRRSADQIRTLPGPARPAGKSSSARPSPVRRDEAALIKLNTEIEAEGPLVENLRQQARTSGK